MTLAQSAWEWTNGTPAERGAMVRRHADSVRPVPRENLKNLFCLTDAGLDAILRGEPWREEYEAQEAGPE